MPMIVNSRFEDMAFQYLVGVLLKYLQERVDVTRPQEQKSKDRVPVLRHGMDLGRE